MLRIVMVVDDEPGFLSRFVAAHDKWFAKAKLEVQPAESLAKARQFLQTRGNEVEIALVDIKLPQPQQAVDLLAYLKMTTPAIKRVAMTVHAQKDDVGRLVAGRLIDGYFNKDWTPQRIRKEIKRVLEEPCEPPTHRRIVEAVRLWLKQNPQAKKRRIPTLGRKARTLEEIAGEIEKETHFGIRQERLIYQLAWNLFAGKPKPKKAIDVHESH